MLAGAPQTPVVICHGGPGAPHDYCEPISDLSRFGRACVLYDQLGCGKSDLLPDAPADFWTPQLFKDELSALTRHLGIADRFAIVGQSWGGMLAMDYALDDPRGLHEIATPTLLVSGRYDEATPLIVGQIHERIPGAEWVLFEESSHMPHVEESVAFLAAVETFLLTID